MAWIGILGEERAPGGDRIIERRRERIFRRQPVIDRRHRCTGSRGKAPGQVAVKRRRPGDISAAMQVENVMAGPRFRRHDADRRDAAQQPLQRLDPGRRARDPPLISMEPLSPLGDADFGPGAALDEKARAEPYQLGLDADTLRCRQRKALLLVIGNDQRPNMTHALPAMCVKANSASGVLARRALSPAYTPGGRAISSRHPASSRFPARRS